MEGPGACLFTGKMRKSLGYSHIKYREHLSNLEAFRPMGCTVYVLWCPVEKEIRYVGYTRLAPWVRFQAHLAEARRVTVAEATDKHVWLKALAEKGMMPVMRVLKCFANKIPAYRMEAELISSIGSRRLLVNLSKGCPNWGARFGFQTDWRDAA